MKMNIVDKAIKWQTRGWYTVPHLILSLFSLEIPYEVKFCHMGGADSAHFVHRAPGTVIHPNTTIGKRVQIYQGVTIGKAKPWDGKKDGYCDIKDDVILCAGAKILFKDEKLVVGRGTVIGANSVLTQSTGEYEVWAGVPAKKIGNRER